MAAKELKVELLHNRLGTVDEWAITGLSDGSSIPLYLHLRYPDTEWPETGNIEGSREMLQALYDKWQTSEKLERESKNKGKREGLVFITPYGTFATFSFHVGRITEVVAIANTLQEESSEAQGLLERLIMAQQGFNDETMEEIHKNHGTTYANWPKPLLTKYHAAETLAHGTMQQVWQRGEWKK